MNTLVSVLSHCGRCRRPLSILCTKPYRYTGSDSISKIHLSVVFPRNLSAFATTSTTSLSTTSKLKTRIEQCCKKGIVLKYHNQIGCSSFRHMQSLDASNTSFQANSKKGDTVDTLQNGTRTQDGEESTEKKSRFSNWTGKKNGWKVGVLSLAVAFGISGVILVCEWGRWISTFTHSYS